MPERYSLSIAWVFGPEGHIDGGTLMLANNTDRPLTQVQLCVSGLVRFDRSTAIEGATLTHFLSNYAVFEPSSGKVIEPGQQWCIQLGEPSYPMRHYSEGIVGAYLVLADGSTVDVSIVSNTAVKDGVRYEPKQYDAPIRLVDSGDDWCITPYPNQVSLSGSASVPDGLSYKARHEDARTAVDTFIAIASELYPDATWYQSITTSEFSVEFDVETGFGSEQYRLLVVDRGATVIAAGSAGFLYGLISLGQLINVSTVNDAVVFPVDGRIDDQPAMLWRGCHLDVARQFYPVKTLKRFLCVLAWNKLNRFHWHLSDDEAWRIEVKAYPELTSVGAWRAHDHVIPPVLGAPASQTGGFYTQDDVRELVSLANRLGIAVIPELDMPGHCFAALQSVSSLSIPDAVENYRSLQGFPNNCLDPLSEDTYQFVDNVLDELLPLFPDNYWHVGADEVPETAWADAQQPTRSLQALFLKRVHAELKSRGVITGAWQEGALEQGIGVDQSYMVGWLDTDIAKKLATNGYNVVVSAGQAYYLDMAQADDWSEPGLAWASSVSTKQTYEFDPCEGWDNTLLSRYMGVQACIWSEQMTSEHVFDYLVFPRLSAVAETAWTTPSNKNWARFKSVCNAMPRLYKQ